MRYAKVLIGALAVLGFVGCSTDKPTSPTSKDGGDEAVAKLVVSGRRAGGHAESDVPRGFPPPDELTCVQCHDQTSLITGKQQQWAESLHGTGEAYVRGTSASCAGCHSGGAAGARIAAGLAPNEVTAGDPAPTRQDCRTCHQIHTTGTDADWALKSTAPVAMYAVEGTTFDGGDGNLCVQCHQPRRVYPGPNEEGIVTGITSHWGPHHGPQSAMMMGVAGAGVEGRPGTHYRAVDNTCVTCHMGSNDDHTWEPQLSACQVCHGDDVRSFDIDGVQTEIEELTHQLGELLVAAGLIDENSEDGHPIVTSAPEAQAIALYNWIYVSHEDKSKGVHNPAYARALLEAGIAALE